MKLVVIEPLGIPKEDLKEKIERMLPQVEYTLYDDRGEGEELTKRGLDADIVLVANQPLPEESVKEWKNLKLLAVAFTGLDHVPVKHCEERGIPVLNASGYSNVAVAELVFGMILARLRTLFENDALTRAGKKQTLPGVELAGKTLGILGMGSIGTDVCKLGQAFGCRILAWSRTEKPMEGVEWKSLEEVLSESDIVTIHLPYDDSTHHIIGKEELNMLKEDAILVNIARGGVIDEEAMVEMLKASPSRTALLDVYKQEPPLPKDHPLLSLDNTMLTPHIGFFTEEALSKRADIILGRIVDFLQ